MLEIKDAQVSFKNLGKVLPIALQTSNPGAIVQQVSNPGWYYDNILGWCYVDMYGNIHHTVIDPVTGLSYTVLGFDPENIYAATTIKSDAPIMVVEGDIISVTYSFKYAGEACSVNIRVGNACKSLPPFWDRGEYSQWASKTLSQSTTPLSYSGMITFVFGSWVIDKNDLFVEIEGSNRPETVYTNAFTKVVGEFTELKITNYART